MQKAAIYKSIYTNLLFWGAIIAFYTLFEAIIKSNPYIQLMNSMDIYTQHFYITEIRFGLKRCQALFSMHTTLGAVALTYMDAFYYMQSNIPIY